MRAAIHQRLALARELIDRPWVQALVLLWGAIGIWDTALSQLVPETISKDAPRVYQIAIWLLNMTGGWLPFWGWLLIGAGLLVIGTLEFAFRATREERLRQRYAQPPDGSEKGFLDFQADGLQAMEDMTKAITVSNKDTARFAKGLVKYGSKIQYITNPQRKRRHASRAANYINAYSGKLQKTANFIASITPVVAENQIGVINQEINAGALQLFADTAGNTAEDVLPGTIGSLQGMRESASSIKGISADLNAASSRLDIVLGDYIEKIKKFRDVCKQLQATALNRISELNKK